MHLCILVFNCIFYALLILGIIGLNMFLDIGSSIAMIVVSYFFKELIFEIVLEHQ